MRGLWLGIAAAWCLVSIPAKAQFSAKWDQFLPLNVTAFGNGDVAKLLPFDGKLYAYVGNEVFSSTDGDTWESERRIPSRMRPEMSVGGVAFDFDDDEMSTNLVDWSPIITVGGRTADVVDIDFASGWWVAVNRHGQIFRSSDLKEWRSERTPTQGALWSVDFFNSHFVAIGDAPNSFTSDEGEFWNVHERSGQEIPVSNFKALGPVLVNVWGLQVYSSSNGISWSAARISTTNLTNIEYADETYVAVGQRGSCFVSTKIEGPWETLSVPGVWDLLSVAHFKSRWFIGGRNGSLLVANPLPAQQTPKDTLRLEISSEKKLSWEGEPDTSYVVEDSKDMQSWSVLGKADPGVHEFTPPVNSRSRYFRIREEKQLQGWQTEEQQTPFHNQDLEIAKHLRKHGELPEFLNTQT